MSDSGSTGNSPPAVAGDADTISWEQLRRSRDSRAFAAAWLDILSRTFPQQLFQAVVVMGKQGQPCVPVAVWPVASFGTPNLTGAVEAAISRQQAVIAPHGQRQVLACPLLVDGSAFGAAAIEIANTSKQEAPRLLQQLEWSMAWLQLLVHRSRYTVADRLVTVLNLVATSLHYEEFQAAATAAVTELAAVLQCERVSIGFLSGRHSRAAALSHSATFNRKTNAVRAIEAAMDEAIDQKATVLWPALSDGALQVTRCHEALAADAGSGAICSVPFGEGEHMLGALTLELPAGAKFDQSSIALCEHVATLLGPVLEVKRRDDRWLATKALDSLKTYLRKLAGPRHTALKLVSAGLIALMLVLLFVDGEYRVTADARVEGIVQRAVAAPLAGFVADANVRAGDVVRQGELLFTLDDRDLRLERLKWVSQRSQYVREHNEALAQHDRAKANILAAQIDQAGAQINLLEEQLQRIQVVAPFDSFVVSGDLSQSLGAPVERGDILFEVAPLNAYRVILEVDERDIGDLAVGQRGQLALAGLHDEVLPVEVSRITPVATTAEGRNFFRVEASLPEDVSTILRPGMQGVGKVIIDERRLAWIWSHKIIQWWRMFIWSWWP